MNDQELERNYHPENFERNAEDLIQPPIIRFETVDEVMALLRPRWEKWLRLNK
jgi:hypothetical protein